jgi:hypothetical protein
MAPAVEISCIDKKFGRHTSYCVGGSSDTRGTFYLRTITTKTKCKVHMLLEMQYYNPVVPKAVIFSGLFVVNFKARKKRSSLHVSMQQCNLPLAFLLCMMSKTSQNYRHVQVDGHYRLRHSFMAENGVL